MRSLPVIAAGLLALSLSPALAEDAPAGPLDAAPRVLTGPDGRSFACDTAPNGALSCRPEAPTPLAGDQAAAIATLERRVADLEAEVAALKKDRLAFGPEDEKKIDRFLDFSDRAFRRFFGLVEDLKQDLGEEQRF